MITVRVIMVPRRKFNCTLPYVQILHKSKPTGVSKYQILKGMPPFVKDGISELLR